MHKGAILISYWNYQMFYPIMILGYNVRISCYVCMAKVCVPKRLAILFPIEYGISIYLQNINSTDFVNKLS